MILSRVKSVLRPLRDALRRSRPPRGWRRIAYKRGRYLYWSSGRSKPETGNVVFLVFHGGGFVGGAPLDNAWWGTALARFGRCYLAEYATFRTAQATIDDALRDGIDAARAVRARHPEARIVLVGFSAGAVLAAWAARDLGAQAAQLVMFSAVTNLEPGGYRNAMVPEGGRADLSPSGFLADIPCPVLAFHATQDPVVPHAHAVAFDADLRAAGHESRLVTAESEIHGFHRDERHLATSLTEIEADLRRYAILPPDYPDPRGTA